MSEVDDFLGLGATSLADLRWIALGGCSGSGKSTLAAWLVQTHPDLGEARWLQDRPLSFEAAQDARDGLWVVDEVVSLRQLRAVGDLLARGNRVVVATHLPAVCFHLLRARWHGRYWHTDRGHEKLARHLARRGVRSSDEGLRRFTSRYGANYTDLDIILEAAPNRDFDRSLARFERLHRLTRHPA